MSESEKHLRETQSSCCSFAHEQQKESPVRRPADEPSQEHAGEHLHEQTPEHTHGHTGEHAHKHSHEHASDAEELRSERIRLLISGSVFLLLLLLEHVFRLPFMKNRLISTLLYLIPCLTAGLPVIREALESLVHGHLLGEEFLMTAASAGAFATGENAEAAAVLVLYCLGEYLQDLAVRRSRTSIRKLMDLKPEYANLADGDGGSFRKAAPEDVRVNDILVILPGERIPVDGTVLSGTSMVDTSSVTGESVPKSVGTGSPVYSGCINGSGTLRLRADREYRNSTVARIMELTENAAERKSSTEDFVAGFSAVYTPAVVAAAVLLAAVPPLLTGGGFLLWLNRACTFLVISCPCALVISVPLCFFGGIGAAGRHGILIKGSSYLEALTHLTVFASDKTGTLTKGEFRVTKLILKDGKEILLPDGTPEDGAEPFRSPAAAQLLSPEAEQLLCLAAAAEHFSDHPIANSIRKAASVFCGGCAAAARIPSDSHSRAGSGMTVSLDGNTVLAGNERLLQEAGVSFLPSAEAGTRVYLAENGSYLGMLLISDTVKPEAGAALADLRRLGVKKLILLTGDTQEAAGAVKKALKLDEVRSELLPQDKVVCLEEYLSGMYKNSRLAYAGDGINDAPVLARADIGIAMGSLGSDAAIESADIVIMDDNIGRIPLAVRIARRTLQLCRQNIVFILLIKLSFLILGALGLATMWMAVFADVGVALLCVLNSMRILLYK